MTYSQPDILTVVRCFFKSDIPIGALIEFTNLGEINIHLVRYERSLLQDAGNDTETRANSVLVLMVKGLFSRLQFPYAQFPCRAVSAWGSPF